MVLSFHCTWYNIAEELASILFAKMKLASYMWLTISTLAKLARAIASYPKQTRDYMHTFHLVYYKVQTI